MTDRFTRRRVLGAVLVCATGTTAGCNGARSVVGGSGSTTAAPETRAGRSPTVDRSDGDRPTPTRTTTTPDRDRIGRVRLDGRRYRIYRYGTGGIEVFDGGGPVSTESRVDRVLRTYAWRETVAALLDRRSKLADAGARVTDRAKTIAARLGPAERALEFVLDRIDQLKSIGIERGPVDVDLWDALTTAYPGLGTLEAACRAAHPVVESWAEPARRVEEAVPALVSYLDGLDGVTGIDAGTARTRVREARSALSALESEADDLLRTVESVEFAADAALAVAERSPESILDRIRSKTDVQIPPGTERLARDAIETASGELRTLADRLFEDVVDPLLAPVDGLSDAADRTAELLSVDPAASARRRRLKSAWEDRRAG